MAHFYGEISGNRGTASRLGSAQSGLRTTASGWGGSIYVRLYQQDGVDHYCVYLTPWQGSGGHTRVLAEGVLDASVTESVTS